MRFRYSKSTLKSSFTTSAIFLVVLRLRYDTTFTTEGVVGLDLYLFNNVHKGTATSFLHVDEMIGVFSRMCRKVSESSIFHTFMPGRNAASGTIGCSS